jgi:hypothetical protein
MIDNRLRSKDLLDEIKDEIKEIKVVQRQKFKIDNIQVLQALMKASR